MSTAFFGGAFFGGEFFSTSSKTGTGGIDQKGRKKYLPVKPTGLQPKKRGKITKNDEIVQEIEQIALDVAEKIALPEVQEQEFEKITLSEIDHEIGSLLKKKQKTEEEKRRIAMMLIILAANA